MQRSNSADDDGSNDDVTNWIAGERAAERATGEIRADGGSDQDVDRERSPISARESKEDLLDAVADLGHDAIDVGDLDADDAAEALRSAAKELDRRARRQEGDR